MKTLKERGGGGIGGSPIWARDSYGCRHVGLQQEIYIYMNIYIYIYIWVVVKMLVPEIDVNSELPRCRLMS